MVYGTLRVKSSLCYRSVVKVVLDKVDFAVFGNVLCVGINRFQSADAVTAVECYFEYQLQWVHRFGIHSLPPELVTAGDSSASSVSQQEPEFTGELQLAARGIPEQNHKPAESPEPHVTSSGLNRFTSLVKNCLDDVGRVVDPEIGADSSVPALNPVPACGPQRLRRWITSVGPNDLPKAS